MPSFGYQGLFARNVPESRRQSAVRTRYEFAVAWPDPETLPLEGLAQGLTRALKEEGRELAFYPHPLGYRKLRDLIVGKLERERGIRITADDVLLGGGSMQGLQHLFEVLLDPGDIVLTEEFTYLGTLRLLRRFQATIIGIPCDAQGMRMDALAETLQELGRQGKRPKAIYTVPTFQNPMGSDLPVERRRELVRLAHQHQVPIVEDDVYVDLRFEGEETPSVYSMDGGSGIVLYAGSFSKIVAPGVRMGWVVASPEVMGRLLEVKRDAGTNELAAMAIHAYLQGHMAEHVAEINQVLRVKRDAMLASLGEYFGPQASWSHPQGGMYLWVKLPEGADAVACQPKAMAAGVSYFPGTFFAAQPGNGQNYLRLCFGYPTTDEIQEGVRLLAQVLEREGALPH